MLFLFSDPSHKGQTERLLRHANAMPSRQGPITLAEIHEIIDVAIKAYRSDEEIGIAAPDVPRAPLDISKNP